MKYLLVTMAFLFGCGTDKTRDERKAHDLAHLSGTYYDEETQYLYEFQNGHLTITIDHEKHMATVSLISSDAIKVNFYAGSVGIKDTVSYFFNTNGETITLKEYGFESKDSKIVLIKK